MIWCFTAWTTLRGPRPVRRWLGFMAAGALFQVLTFVQPDVRIGVVLVAALLWLQVPPRGKGSSTHGTPTFTPRLS
jgi:hypothetical protein